MSCMVTTTHTMVVELSHEVVVSLMRWLFGETTASFSLLALSPPHHEKSYVALHETTYETAGMYQCTCSNDIAVLLLLFEKKLIPAVLRKQQTSRRSSSDSFRKKKHHKFRGACRAC
jgi:hypothetical protein